MIKPLNTFTAQNLQLIENEFVTFLHFITFIVKCVTLFTDKQNPWNSKILSALTFKPSE
jgi:hypothetical protein